ncbi:LytR/AlgR family response regulator transcription factor [Spirosoma agri]|uniref:Response regulator transcription factor n=1 Tax=Spirosoma agri TaxID=1987381 RepID=A0A6M0IQP8_9BACT|nr:LytTR family DNA-binding domain-containing protein [Spirosoma agri]NEU70660.1 response regulator transcription factor [Spirosoma agri]
MTILILEDETKIVDELNQILNSLPVSLEVMTSLSSVEAAIHWLTHNEIPDLVLADILLIDGLSFEVFERLNLDIPVIYCTAYAEYALDSFASNVIDYIIKPVKAEKLNESFQKFFRINSLYNQYHLEENLKNASTKSLPIYQGNKIKLLQSSKICYIYRQRDLIYVQAKDMKYLLNRTLDKIEQELDSTEFYRANRRFLINRKSIVHIELLQARKLGVNLDPPIQEPVIISKAKASDFLRWMELEKPISPC